MKKIDKKNKISIALTVFVVVGLVFSALPACITGAEIVVGKGDGFDIEIDAEGNLHKVYKSDYKNSIFEIKYTNNIGLKNGEWNPSIKITETSFDYNDLDLGIDSISGTMFITWTELNSEGDLIYTSISRDNGISWSDPKKMDYNLLLKADIFEPLYEEPGIHSELKIYESQEYYIVQLSSPLYQEWYDTIQALGGTVYSYMPNNAFLVKINDDVKKIVEDLPYVRWIGLYHPAFKIEQGLTDNTGPIEVNVMVFRDGGSRENVKSVTNEIKNLGGEIIHDGMDNYIIISEIDVEMIHDLALIPDVAWIDEYGEAVPDMDNIRIYTGADFLQNPPHDYDGGGYIVGEVRDMGVDIPIFPDPPSHQDLATITLTDGTADETRPNGEHGTPVCGVAFGNGNGMPAATGMLTNAVGAFANYYDTTSTSSIVQLDAWGGVFQSNSWHSGTLDSSYASSSTEVDLLIFTYDITMLYSAGNSQDGVGPNTLGQESVAKNAICVGGLFDQGNTDETDDRWEDHGIGATPSQGPTVDGRIKPDITGPYDGILTTDSVDGDANDGYVAGNYAIFSGTSFSTPVVAGASGIINQMYDDNYFGNNPAGGFPHAATVKALLINSAHQKDIPPLGLDPLQGDGRFQQGWGMVDLDNRLADENLEHFIVDEDSNLQVTESDRYTIHVRNTLEPLKITLDWTDPPGSHVSSITDVYNDLNLRVTDLTTGTSYWGNNGLIGSRWSLPGGLPDPQNNVENVFIENPTGGPWQIEIIAQTITADGDTGTPELDQNYALVASYFPALEVPLIEGWQLISLPLEQQDTTLDVVLRSIDPYYDAVQYYDTLDAADPWKHWKRNKPFGNDLTDLNHEMGFYIYILGIPEITLYVYGLDFTVNFANYVPVTLYDNAGIWNMVGYPSNKDNFPRDNALNNLQIDVDIDSVWIYDTSLGVERKLEDYENFELGRGYWFAMILPLPSPPEWQVLIDP